MTGLYAWAERASAGAECRIDREAAAAGQAMHTQVRTRKKGFRGSTVAAVEVRAPHHSAPTTDGQALDLQAIRDMRQHPANPGATKRVWGSNSIAGSNPALSVRISLLPSSWFHVGNRRRASVLPEPAANGWQQPGSKQSAQLSEAVRYAARRPLRPSHSPDRQASSSEALNQHLQPGPSCSNGSA